MKRLTAAVFGCILGAAATSASAQSLEDLNIQFHGYANQNFLYTTNNNIFTTTSSNGSPDWTEAVVNLSAQPTPKLRFAVQARYQLFGNYANDITIDYAMGDYKVDDRLGVRFGKVKIPLGLFNEIQDIDPSYSWALLPQSVYPIASRNGQLSLFGGVAYGVVALPSKLGKLEYRAWSGENSVASNDGYFITFNEGGISLPNGLSAIENGGALHWKTPLPGLMIGVSDFRKNDEAAHATAANGAVPATFNVGHYNSPDVFGKYEKNKWLVAAEWLHVKGTDSFNFGAGAAPLPFASRGWYAMASYKVTDKFTVGTYDSQDFSTVSPLGPARYSKDWVASTRYDFTQYLYAKAEEHFIQGTAQDYDTDLNPAGLKPATKLTVLKVGVSF
jgi:hypothetical protein